jgi:glycosyltransferase involved in cell wall biosynthesis
MRAIGRGPTHALFALPRLARYDAVFSDSEHVGLFVGLMLRIVPKRPRHVVLAHHLSPPKKHLFVKLAKRGIDKWILHSNAQSELLRTMLSLRPDDAVVLPYQVDTWFWKPLPSDDSDGIVSAGLECRDYETLLAAVEASDIPVRIGAASRWSRKKNLLEGVRANSNVTVTSFDYPALREAYASSNFVVVPLLDVDFQAGITTILEAMAMGKAVITTRTIGHCGAVVGPNWNASMVEWPESFPLDEATGIYVPPRDVAALKAAIDFLMTRPDIAATLGANGRRDAVLSFDISRFVKNFGDVITATSIQPHKRSIPLAN